MPSEDDIIVIHVLEMNVEYGYESCNYDSLKVSLGYKTLQEGNFWGNLNFAVSLMVIMTI